MVEALACTDAAPVDLILMNLELPGPNGIEATRAAQAASEMSRGDHVRERLRALRTALDAGALAFVSKRELPHALLPLIGRLPA